MQIVSDNTTQELLLTALPVLWPPLNSCLSSSDSTCGEVRERLQIEGFLNCQVEQWSINALVVVFMFKSSWLNKNKAMGRRKLSSTPEECTTRDIYEFPLS
jgi:hypothetical protein